MLTSNPKNNVVTQLCQNVKLPRMVRVRQKFDPTHLTVEEIPGVIFSQMEREAIRSQIKPGMSIAITCGSRGVANIAIITRAIVDFVKQCGAKPFIFPAMGSHGGATAQGQVEILAGYGVTEEAMGCPIRATMETVQVGTTCENLPVFVDKYAYEADGIILCGRVKAHTAFRGPYESGIMKMAVIGMGKQHGAETVHESGFVNMGRILPQAGNVILDNTNVICGIALIENAFDETYKIQAMTKQEVPEGEPPLLVEAKQKMGQLYFDNVDVLVVDRIGKNFSGDGMDPNVTGRFATEAASGGIRAQRIAVLGLSEETHHNANGIGLADVTTKRLVEEMDVDITYPNGVTSTVLHVDKIPMFTHSDKLAVQLALRSCNMIDKEHPRILHIQDTMHIEYIEISEDMLEEARNNPNIEALGEPEDWKFDENGNLW